MIESDHNEIEEGEMDTLRLSSDSADNISKKRPRDSEDSEDEIDLSKKRRCSFSERSKILENDNPETISEKNNTERYYEKVEKYKLYRENQQSVQEVSDSDMNGKNKEKQGDDVKRGNEKKTENNITLNKNSGKINIKEEIVESMDNSVQKSIISASMMSIPKNEKETTGGNEVKEENDKTIAREENKEEDETKKQHTAKKHIVDTEVVDGLELSVECASDKEESSSESENEKDVKPRPKTIIVKAEPNESELDCSSEAEEKPDLQQITDTLKIKSEKNREKAAKRKGSRSSFSKLKTSGSEDSQNSNSDEDYSPRTKKKMTKSPATKKSTDKHRSVESKRGRGKDIRNSHPKNTECLSDDEDMTTAEKANKTTQIKNGLQEELSDRESFDKNESDNSEKEEKSMKRRGRRSNADGNEQIQKLKRYLNVAGVKIQSYNRIFADCKNNAAKINRLKELLKENGISGHLSLKKCKRAREENEKMREVSELDMSNIISEGRVTRARRNMDNVKKTLPDVPLRYRERNTFRLIQTVVDSDSE
ncbi:HIRA-interacting protein 3 [Trachymyrmex zeteki]|uniref:HIRA-interacting protein 3 n=1 Tax=Mycetomoellerius zeteki TaxID=64791 RepID=A0A151WUP7_9HYME|nr:PREDICTED: HIRA-interacting protein 3-like isoform X1 [Trachymyrmex zeteki]XP_018308881.1 PREDICTED: HIRA-interacting protein 3-like isoform X2 [Trachymyrmex zeteki]XP_018308882.1 PREDICTED: HIRA-interacting protein 3-like isoform X2 [Trachymyrmex zeteki]KYQ51652.1 HIRA-interacting protein 3 [Trachymyrmex zeteki]